MKFKLLAIRPLRDCDSGILKILKSEKFYFFDNSYEPSDDKQWIKKADNNLEYIPDDFFFKKNGYQSSLQSINVQALVGKNGDGKSSLTELALRIFNNFFKANDFHEVTKRLVFVKNLHAELYFSIDNIVYRILVRDTNLAKPIASIGMVDGRLIQEKAEILANLFFIINVNYSHYSLNSKDYIKESTLQKGYPERSWLDNVFHRNDGYQTPLTVHPFRNEGNIDINTERDLINQRLINLILTEPSYEVINTGLKVEEINFVKFKLKPILNEITRITNTYELEESREFDDADPRFLNLSLVNNIDENDYFISILIDFVDNWAPPSFRGNERQEHVPYGENFQFISGSKRERILKYLAWLAEAGTIEIMKLSVMCRAILSFILGVAKNDPLQNLLFQYLCVKATKMLKYPQYKEIDIMIYLGKEEQAIKAYLENLQGEMSHVSLKFNQALHLLILVRDFPSCELAKFYKGFLEGPKDHISVSLIKLREYIINAIHLNNTRVDEIFFNPPGIFKNSVMLKDSGEKELIELRGISSGEYQKIGLISSIIYHLKNIDSIQTGKFGEANKYDKVLLMLDEIELYFHPDFQRSLVSDLLKKIIEVKFKQIKAINILFVTHSPFVLSDIPKSNVMFIENGTQSYPMTENTFGGNIHTLLQHGFFLKGVPIGEFAKNKINELFNILNQQIDLGKTHNLEKRILMVSEPFLRSQLLKLYHERTSSIKMDALLNRISDLENSLNDKN